MFSQQFDYESKILKSMNPNAHYNNYQQMEKNYKSFWNTPNKFGYYQNNQKLIQNSQFFSSTAAGHNNDLVLTEKPLLNQPPANLKSTNIFHNSNNKFLNAGAQSIESNFVDKNKMIIEKISNDFQKICEMIQDVNQYRTNQQILEKQTKWSYSIKKFVEKQDYIFNTINNKMNLFSGKDLKSHIEQSIAKYESMYEKLQQQLEVFYSNNKIEMEKFSLLMENEKNLNYAQFQTFEQLQKGWTELHAHQISEANKPEYIEKLMIRKQIFEGRRSDQKLIFRSIVKMPWFKFVLTYGLLAAGLSGYYELNKREDKNKVNETARKEGQNH